MRFLLPLALLLALAACGPVHEARQLCNHATRHIAGECRDLHVATRARSNAPSAHRARFHEAVVRASHRVLRADSLYWSAHADTLRMRLAKQE